MALAAAPALADTGSEAGDTGDLPASAQEVGPAGSLEAIDGSIAGFADRDVYKICLTGGGNFSASTVGRTGWDTQLFLLDSQGRAVYANVCQMRICALRPRSLKTFRMKTCAASSRA